MQHPHDPYRPPRYDHAYGHGYGGVAHYGPYQPLGWKTTAASVGIIATVVLGFILAALPMAMRGPPQENLGLSLALGLVSLLSSAVSIGTIVVYLVWTHQAAKNVRAFGQEMLEFTPGWAVGWWFIPFASLWLPYKALREIWRASDPDTVGDKDGTAWLSSPVPGLFPLWWSTYIFNGVVATFIAFAQVMRSLEHPGEPNVGGGPYAIGGHVFQIVAALAIVSIMKQLDRRQEACAAKLERGERAHSPL